MRVEKFEKLLKFREAMGVGLSEENVKYIWGKKFLKEIQRNRDSYKLENFLNRNVYEKISIAKREKKRLKVFKWVKFIGISGSVGAGFASEEDDIDMFVVVRNGTMWIYRGVIVFRNLFHNKIRAKRHKNTRDKLCVNLICEERGLKFPADIFNFHELIFLKPLYRKEYKSFLLSQNKWLEKDFLVKKELLRTRELPSRKVFFLIRITNYLAFILQLLFMMFSGHNPDTKRLKENNRKGRIEFFEYDYRSTKIDTFEREFN